MSRADAKDTSADAGVGAVLFTISGIYSSNDELFFPGKYSFDLLPTLFDESLVKNLPVPRGSSMQLISSTSHQWVGLRLWR